MSYDQSDATKPADNSEQNSTQNATILAGRAFAQHYKHSLTDGERAILRRTEIASTCGTFWACMHKATREWPHAKEARNIRIFESLVTSAILEDASSTDDTENVGAFMRRNSHVIKGRRVESMLAATTRDTVIDELSRLIAITRGAKIDFGMLFNDLVFFGDPVRRRWASKCFN